MKRAQIKQDVGEWSAPLQLRCGVQGVRVGGNVLTPSVVGWAGEEGLDEALLMVCDAWSLAQMGMVIEGGSVG